MTFIDHLKEEGNSKILEVAFGRHVVAGDLAKSIVTGTSPTHVVQIQQILGEAFGKGWQGIIGVWFRGINRSSSKYKFHPGKKSPTRVYKTFTADSSTDVITSAAHGYSNGTMVFVAGSLPSPLEANKIYYVINSTTNTFKLSLTSGGSAIDLTTNGSGTLQVWKNDSVQGIDEVFHQDTPHTNTAWIRVECPNGSETGIPDVDTKNNPPEGFYSIVECQTGEIYDEDGNVDGSDIYLTNPADIIAFGCKEIRRYENSRINFQSLANLKPICNEQITPDYTTLPQGVGLTGRYYDGNAFNTLKSKRVDPVIQYELSTGSPALDITPTNFSVRWEGKIRPKHTETYTFYLTHNGGGRLWINNLSTALIDQWATTGTHSATISLTADQFYDIKIEWENASGDSEFKLEWQSANQPRQVVPQDRLYPKNEAMNRFECHAAFTAETTFDDFLRQVLFSCNGIYQDADGKLSFYCIDELTPTFAFDDTNIIKNTFKVSPRFTQQELLNLPNRFIAEGRDLESRYLEKFDPELFYDLPDLQAKANKIITENVVVGNSHRWQCLDNLRHYAKIRTSDMICEFDGMPQTLSVMPGDLVTVTKAEMSWTNKQFLVLEATDKSIGKAADERIFKLLEWN